MRSLDEVMRVLASLSHSALCGSRVLLDTLSGRRSILDSSASYRFGDPSELLVTSSTERIRAMRTAEDLDDFLDIRLAETADCSVGDTLSEPCEQAVLINAMSRSQLTQDRATPFLPFG